MRELALPPTPLTRGQKVLLAALCAVVAVSRRYALSKSPLDWDESLFAAGVRQYDVTLHHPHPPGYPLFILLAKVFRLFVPDDFHALQAVASLASLLLFPAVFFLLRELRFRYLIAVGGALVTAFLPTVWYYGGTALSDVPALCAAVIASALLLAGARYPRMWIAGMVVAGITGGIRPMHVMIAAVPAIIGGARRQPHRAARPSRPLAHARGDILAGCALFAAIIVVSYAGAAMATPNPPWGYLEQVGVIAHHVASNDSFHNSLRAPLRTLAAPYFLYSHRGARAGLVLIALAAIGFVDGAIRRRANVGVVAAMFVPIALASWLLLDTTAVTRYGLAYAMLYSAGSVFGIDALTRLARNEIVRDVLTAASVTALVLPLVNWTRPALALVRHRVSPPIAAMRWTRAHVPPVGPTLWLSDMLHFHAGYELAQYHVELFDNAKEIPPDAYVTGNYCLVDRLTLQPHGRLFAFPHTRLADIARGSFFETTVIPMDAMVRFGEGWYQDECDAERRYVWRWMQQSSTTLFPPLGTTGVLHLVFHIPVDAMPRPPTLTILWNGTVIERRVCRDLDYDQRYVLASRTGAANECRIVVDEIATAKSDPRHFGLQLFGLSWERADGVSYGF